MYYVVLVISSFGFENMILSCLCKFLVIAFLTFGVRESNRSMKIAKENIDAKHQFSWNYCIFEAELL